VNFNNQNSTATTIFSASKSSEAAAYPIGPKPYLLDGALQCHGAAAALLQLESQVEQTIQAIDGAMSSA
jgi:hypothetical protein